MMLRQVDEASAMENLRGFSDHSYRQGASYARGAARQTNSQSAFYEVVQGDTVVAIANVRVKRLPMGLGGIAYINQGPACLRTDNLATACYEDIITAFVEYFVHDRGLVLRVSPPISHILNSAFDFDKYSQMGFKGPYGNYLTFVLDLNSGIENLRKNLHRKWRGHLNKSEKFAQVISYGLTPNLFDQLDTMLDELASTKGFEVPQGARFYERVCNEATDPECYKIFYSEFEGEIASIALASFTSDTAVYLLGATSDAGRQIRAAYAIQWSMMSFAANRGIRYYDMGGVDQGRNPSVYEFKERTNGRFLEAPIHLEYAPSLVKGKLVSAAEIAYRWFAKLL